MCRYGTRTIIWQAGGDWGEHAIACYDPATRDGAIVLVDGDGYAGPFYIRKPFTQEPDWAVTSINLDLDALLERATAAEGSL